MGGWQRHLVGRRLGAGVSNGEGTWRSLWIVMAAIFTLLWVMAQDRMLVEEAWHWWLSVWGLLP